MALLTLSQQSTFDQLYDNISMRNSYADILRGIRDHEKAVDAHQCTIDNYRKGLFKPTGGSIAPWKKSVEQHSQAIRELKERAEQIRSTLMTKDEMIKMLTEMIDTIGEFDGL